MSKSIQTIRIRITVITTKIATIIAAPPLIRVPAVSGTIPAILLFHKTRIIISPTSHNGQKMNAIGKKIIVITV